MGEHSDSRGRNLGDVSPEAERVRVTPWLSVLPLPVTATAATLLLEQVQVQRNGRTSPPTVGHELERPLCREAVTGRTHVSTSWSSSPARSCLTLPRRPVVDGHALAVPAQEMWWKCCQPHSGPAPRCNQSCLLIHQLTGDDFGKLRGGGSPGPQ